jgi:hypothetical protein
MTVIDSMPHIQHSLKVCISTNQGSKYKKVLKRIFFFDIHFLSRSRIERFDGGTLMMGCNSLKKLRGI